MILGAFRADGVSDGLVPLGYPAVSHFQVVQSLLEASKGYKEVNAGESFTNILLLFRAYNCYYFVLHFVTIILLTIIIRSGTCDHCWPFL